MQRPLQDILQITMQVLTYTLSMSFGGGCSDSVTYDRTKLVNINGGQGGSNTINNGATVNFAASGQ